MTVAELIKRLKQFDPELTVCLADWNEAWRKPSALAATDLEVATQVYSNMDGQKIKGQFLKIGDDN